MKEGRALRDLNAEALRWLRRHDPEYDWREHDRLHRDPLGRGRRDYVGGVRDNLRSFGEQHAGRMSRALRRAVLS